MGRQRRRDRVGGEAEEQALEAKLEEVPEHEHEDDGSADALE